MPLSENPFTRFGRWVRDQIVQEVPEDIALCELDCRKGQCRTGEWEACERRSSQAAGELMPLAELKPEDEEEVREGTTGDTYQANPALARQYSR